MTRFSDLGLSQPVLQALELKGYDVPTPIQAQAIPPVLAGRDLLGIAQTGTGKTAAFMLPSIDRLRASDNRIPFKSCRMLVLAPTRELAVQISASAKDYGALAGLKVQVIVGGTSVNKDRNKLHRGTDILVATPGRLLDLIDQNAFNLSGVEVLVLDEADQMLDLGFIHALRKIRDLVPKERQTLFFSATMPKAIKELVNGYCTNPVQVSVTPESSTAERIDQYLFMVQQDEKQSLLEMILSGRHEVPGKTERVLIFARTKHGADRVVKRLSQRGIAANAIHGNKSQGQRQRALDEFRSGRTQILVATDVAARGIDIPGVSHVINYELPNVPEQYVHRIGRTARAGRDGIAIAFCAEDERAYLKDITRTTDAEFERLPLPDNFRAVVEGVGPVKPPVRGATRVSQKKVKPRPAGASKRPERQGGEETRSKPKHPARKGRPNRSGGERSGGQSGQRSGGQGGQGGQGAGGQRRRRGPRRAGAGGGGGPRG
ncbi:ATP-dependent RNA helicase RhlE [Erythrobacter litoralis]|uniref:DEAD/DEAH box helicase n=1 Tax=Erythrobacter litoralis TaxID=39960 RepID=A0A074MZ91_9SPHN|nr:DEAD/DEAH box helicase [Erythrobacter litoralis]AOL23771.1 ATP-dependent RNA helicase RhlE [Erythrobacter litoralis]KEO98744.1 DEAD/DEAH box helicase [Erythrobacter litoralis]